MSTDKLPAKSQRRKVVSLIIIAGIILGTSLYARYLDGKNSSTTTATSTVVTTTTTSAPLTSYQTPVIQTKNDANLGSYLSDTNGLPLYTYNRDTSGVSNCASSCLTTWPAYVPSGTPTLPANVTVITRTDGTQQFAYKGMPLYFYIYDTEAGSINGSNVSGFNIAQP